MIKHVLVYIFCLLLSAMAFGNDTTLAGNKLYIIPLDSIGENPYSPMYVPRRIGAVLTAAGATGIGLGILFLNNPSWEIDEDEPALFKPRFGYGATFLVLGIGECLAGLILYTYSIDRKLKYDKWEKEKGKIKLSFNGSGIIVHF
ncbi:MAG: hypothetical protein JXA54_03350 [Candidatus Heimdallarchaeota archaeon]|nr:hypothetical protein [Candidatus Heimdallarchaeota archaeon]